VTSNADFKPPPRDQWPLKQADLIRDVARSAITEADRQMLAESMGLSVDRGIVVVLMMAMFDAIREEWKATYTAAGLEHEVAVARKIMADEGYKDPPENEAICGMPGQEPMVCTVDGKKAVAYSHSMFGLMPLSAYFTNKVREAIDIAAMVGEEIKAAAPAEQKPQEPSNGPVS